MLDRKVRKMIEWWLHNYESKRKEAAEYLVELAEQGITARYEGLGIRNSSVSNPTESKGIKTLDGRKTALWCKVVENTLTTFRWEIEYRVIELFYFRHKSRAKICYMLGISERTFTYWTERITDCAYQWACELGLL